MAVDAPVEALAAQHADLDLDHVHPAGVLRDIVELQTNVFQVDAAEAHTPELIQARAQSLAGQFVFDVQTHFIRDDFDHKELLGLNDFASEHWNPKIKEQTSPGLARFKFLNYVKEIYYDSDTQLALLSGAPFDDPSWWLVSNEQIVKAREIVNDFAGSRRLLAHTVITPARPGWMDEVDKAISTYKPNSWKSYTIGDPLAPSKFPWRLDDEKLMYPFYEKAVKAGINTICIHKGLLPPDYEKSFAGVWQYATADDVGKAAKDWPQMNFVIYHSALRPFLELPDQAWAEFEASGRIKWTCDVADIPAKYGVNNVYGEVGTSFANSAVAHPKFAAALVGTLIKGLGADHVLWGTDSVWYGSPQWQIEAMRRLEIPEDMQKKYGFAPLERLLRLRCRPRRRCRNQRWEATRYTGSSHSPSTRWTNSSRSYRSSSPRRKRNRALWSTSMPSGTTRKRSTSSSAIPTRTRRSSTSRKTSDQISRRSSWQWPSLSASWCMACPPMS